MDRIDTRLNIVQQSRNQQTIENYVSQHTQEMIEMLKIMRLCLTENENTIIQHRYDNKETLAQTGKAMGISCERVRQIEDRAIQKLRIMYIFPSRLIWPESAKIVSIIQTEIDMLQEQLTVPETKQTELWERIGLTKEQLQQLQEVMNNVQ